ncbi:MAG: PilC/PilY family type IV pilus protein [Curvibacter sp.]
MKTEHHHAFHRTWGRLLRTGAIGLTLLAALGRGQAEDIDIYSGISSSTDKPNVLFIWDNSANWSSTVFGAPNCYYKDNGVTTTDGPRAGDQGTKFAIEKCAIYNVIDALPVASDGSALFNVGIMLMNESPNNGGYPRIAFTPLTNASKAIFKTFIRNLDIGGDKGSNADYGQAMYEAYLYYKGMSPLNGALGLKRDAAAFLGSGAYNSPAGASCAHNYIIVIGNGSPQTSNPERNVSNLMAARIDADFPDMSVTDRNALKAEIVNAALGNDQADWVDEMARFVAQTDISTNDGSQGITTHAIAVLKGNGSDGTFPALMKSTATYGGGSYYQGSSVDAIVLALLDIFNQLQAVNSVFSSASLPVSVNARGTYLNQVYMGMFRPDDQARPRWRGNVKQYKFSYDPVTDSIGLTDVNGQSIVSAATGFIAPGAVSYWTEDSNFWLNQPMGTPASSSDKPDGEVVEKGGAAQRLRTRYQTSQTERRVYTCIPPACSEGTTLSSGAGNQFVDGNSAITQAALNAGSSSERSDIINWIRGTDNAGDEKGPGGTTTIRPSAHGDVLHSRPAVVNYGGSTGVVLFYGANDGLLHAVDGNQTGSGAGEELWTFAAPEHFGKFKRLRDNTPDIRLSTTADVLTTAKPRDYMMDGPIGIYQKINAAGENERVHLYVGMRRGGRAVYAFDVTTPTQPRFLWKRSPSDAGFERLGQTWSEPKVAFVKGWNNPVLIMGAGYDAAAEDALSPGTTTMGHAVLVIDAIDGTLLRALPTDRSVAADVTLMDVNVDGKIDRAYAVDLGGNIYRIDFETETSSDKTFWSIYKLAALRGDAAYPRKFFFAPDVVQAPGFIAVMAGSGDREKPLNQVSSDAFFTVFDRNMGYKPSVTPTPITVGSLSRVGDTSTLSQDGCYLGLPSGEKVVNAPATSLGVTYFATNKPSTASPTSCLSNLGQAKIYAAALFCKTPSEQVLTGGGLPPSPVTGIVQVEYTLNGQTQTKNVGFIIGAPNTKKSGIEGSKIQPSATPVRRKNYWYIEGQK